MNNASFSQRFTSGFTLVELSIVLVIVGLLTGGTLVGADLIRAAEIRAQIKDLESYQTAVNAFKLRFEGLPGDIENATTVFLAAEWPLMANGNGNGVLEDGDDTDGSLYNQFAGEVAQFWMQLGAAKLIDGSFNTTPEAGEGYPESRTDKTAGVVASYDLQQVDINLNSNLFYVGAGISGTDEFIGQHVLTPTAAWKIDSKLDDGHPFFGIVAARGTQSLTTINHNPDYFDDVFVFPEKIEYMFSSTVLGWLIPPAAAGTSVTEATSACIFIDADGSGSASTEAAYSAASYALSNPNVNCQIAVKMDD